MRISDWSSDVCSSDLKRQGFGEEAGHDAKAVEGRLPLLAGARDGGFDFRSKRLWIDEIGGGGDDVLTRSQQHADIVDAARNVILRAGKKQHAIGCGFPHLLPRSEEHTSELQSLMRISYAVFCFK